MRYSGAELYYSGFTDVFEIVLRIHRILWTTTRCLKDIYAGLRRNGGISGFARTYWRAYRQSGVLQDVAPQRNRQTAEH
jgi:hypothetical protein